MNPQLQQVINVDTLNMQKRTLKLTGVAVLASLSFVVVAGPGERGLGPRVLGHYDSNNDRIITQSEIAAVNRDELQTHDTDQDGTLSLAEFEKVWLARMRERMVDRFQRLDADGDGAVTADEFRRPSDRLMTWADRNGDQQLTVHELRKMRGKARGERRRGERRGQKRSE